MSQLKVLFLIAGLFASQAALATVAHSIGIARDAENQALRYIEHHQYLPTGEHLVKYFDHTGSIIVSKTLTYPNLPQHPEIVQTDFTTDTVVETNNSIRSVEMTRKVAGRTETFEVPLDEATIVDAGFDNFLKNNWQGFEEGKPQVFKLAVAGQKSVLKVKITKQTNKGVNTAFAIEPRNFFIRLLVPEMRLLYDPNRRLLAYEGPTNLKLSDGQDQKVSINFTHYRSAEKLAKPRPQWLPTR